MADNLNNRTNNALVQTFSVNNLNELTNATYSGTLTVAGTTTSPATNVTVNSSTANLYADATFAATNFTPVNGNNTYTAIAHDQYGRVSTNSITVNLPTNVGYSNDVNGNVLSDGTRNFAYDDENELASVWVTNVWRSDFVYDGKLRRRIERDYNWSGSSWVETNEVHFIYDGNVVIQERDINNLPKVTYTRGNDLSGTLQGAGGIGGLLARSDNSQMLIGSASAHAYYHADGNGNVTMLINNLQLIVAKYLYDPFGNTLSLSGPLAVANTYRFSSKEWNDNAGIYFYGRRYYDPILQRFINRDPLAERGGINLYGYCGNNPINLYDPLGLCWGEDTLNEITDFLTDLGIFYEDYSTGYSPDAQNYWQEYENQQAQQLNLPYVFNLNVSTPSDSFPDAGGITDLSADYFNTAMTAYGVGAGVNALADSVSGLFAADIRHSGGGDRWNTNMPNLIEELGTSLKREALSFLYPIESLKSFAEAAKSFSFKNPHTPQAVAYALIRVGDFQNARSALAQLLQQLDLKVEWQREMPAQTFSKLVWCSCGCKMYARTDSPKYLCRKCNNKIPIADLDAIFHEEMKAFFADSKKLSMNLRQADQTLKDRQTLIASHQQSIQKVRDEMQQTHRLYVEGHITPQGFGDFYKPAEQRLNQLLTELPKLQADVDFLKVNQISTEDVMVEANALYAKWPSLPLDDRRKIAEAVCEKIVIGHGEIDITYSHLPSSEELCKNQTRL